MADPTITHYHVYPLGDLRKHVVDGYAEGKRCWCNPTADDTDLPVGIKLWIHNAMDKREEAETATKH